MKSDCNKLYVAAGGETYGCGFGPIVQTGTRAGGGGSEGRGVTVHVIET
jgi:hypothetical protein